MATATAAPVRVMIVEDSATVRRLLTHIVAEDPHLAAVAAVGSAEEAIAQLDRSRPDVISMDINLPGMDGLEATRRIMAERPTPIVVVSASIEKSATANSMEALRAGALAVVEKPAGLGSPEHAGHAREICTQLRIMSQVAVVRRRLGPAGSAPTCPARGRRTPPRLIVCAASTGGPQALAQLFAALPAALETPVLLVQHMGAAFMPGFVRWLGNVVPQRVLMAEEGASPRPGTLHVAPGGRHLRVDRAGRLRLGDDPPLRGQRPAATALFTSAAEHLGAAAFGLVLTGMGEDGAEGVRALVASGAGVLAEDETTAVVYGMPAAAVREGATPLPLPMLAPRLSQLIRRSSLA